MVINESIWALTTQSRDATKFAAIFSIINLVHAIKSKHKGSPYSITERRVPELIPVMAVSLQVTKVINPAVGCHYFLPGLQLPWQPLIGLLPVLLLGEDRHDGCEQFACYPTASWLRLEPRLFCAWVQNITTRLPSHPIHAIQQINRLCNSSAYS